MDKILDGPVDDEEETEDGELEVESEPDNGEAINDEDVEIDDVVVEEPVETRAALEIVRGSPSVPITNAGKLDRAKRTSPGFSAGKPARARP